MSEKDFIQQALIAAMNGIMSQPHNLTPTEIAEHALIKAEALLASISKKEYSTDDEGLIGYIEEVDEFHGLRTKELNDRIDQLEYNVQHLISIMENSVGGWINKLHNPPNTPPS